MDEVRKHLEEVTDLNWPEAMHPAFVYSPTLCICLTYKNITVHNLSFKVTKVGSDVSRTQVIFLLYTCVHSLKHMLCWISYTSVQLSFNLLWKKYLILPQFIIIIQPMGFLTESVNYKWLYCWAVCTASNCLLLDKRRDSSLLMPPSGWWVGGWVDQVHNLSAFLSRSQGTVWS